MSEVGLELRHAREGRGISLQQVAASTKIAAAVLESLERGDFKRLPGGIFSRAFVRSYALEVGLDPDTVVAKFVAELASAVPDASEAVRPDVTDDDRAFVERQRKASLVLRIVVGLIVVGVIVAFVVWRMNRSVG